MKTALKIIAVVALIMAGRPAMANPGPSNAVVNFDVTNPDVTITARLPGPGGEATAEFTLAGTGRAYGTFETYTNDLTGWAFLSGGYLGAEGNFSSTFQATSLRTNSGEGSGSSTFRTTQSLDTTGVGLLEFGAAGELVSGLSVYGEAGACSVTNTWVAGIGQTFEATAGSVTIPAETYFEQRNPDGSLRGNPITNQFAVTAAGGDSFAGTGEGGSYDGAALGIQPKTGFGVAANQLALDVRDSTGSTTMSTNVLQFTDQIVGQTATWYTYHDGYNP